MIKLVHHNGSRLISAKKDNGIFIDLTSTFAVDALFELAKMFPDQLIVWCDARWEDNVGVVCWEKLIKSENTMISYACSGQLFIPKEIGLVEDSVFLKIKTDVRYPTWIMSGDLGAMHARVLLKLKKIKFYRKDLDFFLSSIAKVGMPQGLLCYSEPALQVNTNLLSDFKYAVNLHKLYHFVRSHYKKRWLFLLLIQQCLYQHKIVLYPFLKAFLKYQKIKIPDALNFRKLTKSGDIQISNNKIDVLIPTLGRKNYLYQVLQDLKLQGVLPDRVIIIEQNPDKNVSSNLNFLKAETWPFAIIHHFIHKTGACNARNLALSQIQSDWVFFADDDIRVPVDFLEKANTFINTDLTEAFTVSCLRENDKEPLVNVRQWSKFGSGCSFVKAEHLKKVRFDMAFEGGFGEDMDFGMQLRNKGVDVLYNPFLKLTHLKAPVGGFRSENLFPWENEEIQPKPSPTIMALHLKHDADYQLLGYKTVLFLKFYGNQKIKNPFTYLQQMQKRWELSKKWGRQLLK